MSRGADCFLPLKKGRPVKVEPGPVCLRTAAVLIAPKSPEPLALLSSLRTCYMLFVHFFHYTLPTFPLFSLRCFSPELRSILLCLEVCDALPSIVSGNDTLTLVKLQSERVVLCWLEGTVCSAQVCASTHLIKQSYVLNYRIKHLASRQSPVTKCISQVCQWVTWELIAEFEFEWDEVTRSISRLQPQTSMKTFGCYVMAFNKTLPPPNSHLAAIPALLSF